MPHCYPHNKPAHLPPVAAHLAHWIESQGAEFRSTEGCAYATLNGRTVLFLQDLPHLAIAMRNGEMLPLLPHPHPAGGMQSVCGYLMLNEPDAEALTRMEDAISVATTQLRVLVGQYALMRRSIEALKAL